MANLRFTDVQTCPTEFLDLTSATLDEFQQLIPPFEAAFQAHMATWRLDGKARTARQFRDGAERMSRFIPACMIALAREYFSISLTHCLKNLAA